MVIRGLVFTQPQQTAGGLRPPSAAALPGGLWRGQSRRMIKLSEKLKNRLRDEGILFSHSRRTRKERKFQSNRRTVRTVFASRGNDKTSPNEALLSAMRGCAAMPS